ncbi:succinate dehydrogenase, partial [Burkholderia multivorans]
MSTTSIPAPRTGYSRHKSTRSKFEMFAWLFMRLSGIVLVILIFGHLF